MSVTNAVPSAPFFAIGAPGQVTGLGATPASSSQIMLAWATAPAATFYTVYQFGVQIATNIVLTTYQISGLTANTAYTFTVSASNPGGMGPQSMGAGATTLPASAGQFDFYISLTGSNSNSGSLGSPWAISAISDSTKQALYSGKRIGAIGPAIYNVSSLMSTAQDPPALNINGGTAAASTYFAPCDTSGNYAARTVSITAKNGSIFGGSNANNTAMIGQGLGAAKLGYVTLDGFTLTGASIFCVLFGNHNNANVNKSGIVMQNCIVTGNDATNTNMSVASGTNTCPIQLFNGVGAQFINNYVHDNKGWTDPQHFSAAYVWQSQGTIFKFNTIVNSGGLHGKEAGNQGTTIQYNYIDWTAGTGGQNNSCIMGFDGVPTAGMTQKTVIDHNILLSNYEFIDAETELNNGGWTTPVEITANTMVSTVALGNDGVRWFEQAAGTRFLTAYNNLFAGPTPNGYGYWLVNSDAFALCDYNGYASSVRMSTVAPGGHSSGGAATVTTLPAWQTAIGGRDTHSAAFAAQFVGPPNTAAGYGLVAGTPGAWNSATPGRLGGTVSGGAVSLGALDGLTPQVGCNFIAPPASFVGPTPNSVAAAIATATNNALSQSISPYYWEIGDQNGKLLSGTVGTGVTNTTVYNIASASKWVYGSYVAQLRQGQLTAADIPFLNFTSGYTGISSTTACQGTASINACLAQSPVYTTKTQSRVGNFFYDSGHMENHATQLTPLGPLSDSPNGVNSPLAVAIRTQLGLTNNFLYSQPLMAGGVVGNADDYSSFLRDILAGSLYMHDVLGTHAVATTGVGQASPIPEAWHYSIGHWVEDDPAVNGDGAFSSPGAFGFYPWIDKTKTYYGILSRYQNDATPAGYNSAQAGRLIRRAFITGIEQTHPIPSGANPPGQPTITSATGVSTSEIDLAWNAVTGAAGYNVRRGGTIVSGAGVTATTFKDTGLPQGTTQTYTVAAYSDAGEGTQSATASATTQGTGGVPESFWFNDMSFVGLSLNPTRMLTNGLGGWIDFVGTDSLTGKSQPRFPAGPWAASNGASQTDSIQIIADHPLVDETATIRTDRVGPSGAVEPCLEFVYVNAFNNNVGGFPDNSAQLSYMVFPNTAVAQSMTYQRMWLWLQSDFAGRNQGFFGVAETKTNSTERHSLLITKNGSGQPCWQLSHNSAQGGQPFQDYYDILLGPTSITGSGQLAPAPIPLGQWFMVEWAHKFVPGQQGWVWLAVNGVQVYYENRSEWSPRLGERINRIFPFQGYSNLTRSSGSTFTQRVAGGLVHGPKFAIAWPSDATTHPAGAT